MSDGGIDIHRFPRDALLLYGFEEFERAHVVQPVSELHQDDANVVDHGEEHLANVFSLTRFRGHHVEAANFRHALDEPRHFRTEPFLDAGDWKFGVFDDVVKQRGGKRGGVKTHVRKNVGYFQQMSDVRVAGASELVAVPLGGYIKSAAEKPGVLGRAIGTEFLKKLFQAGIDLSCGTVSIEVQRQIGAGTHNPVYARGPEWRRCTTEKRRITHGARPPTAQQSKRPCNGGRALPGRVEKRHAAGVGCSARFCLSSLTLSSKSSACFVRASRSAAGSTLSALRRRSRFK